jgi:hypothetical protein
MKRSELQDFGSPEAITRKLREHQPSGVHTHGQLESLREADYKGRRITIRTTYHIEVDGKAVEGHLGVTNDGRVHYHAVPNLSFASAVDLVKQLIDTFPEDFPDNPVQPSPGTGPHH